MIALEDLPEKVKENLKVDSQHVINNHNKNLTLEEVEKKHILLVLKSVENNLAKAARILGINRSTLYRKLDQYNISLK